MLIQNIIRITQIHQITNLMNYEYTHSHTYFFNMRNICPEEKIHSRMRSPIKNISASAIRIFEIKQKQKHLYLNLTYYKT